MCGAIPVVFPSSFYFFPFDKSIDYEKVLLPVFLQDKKFRSSDFPGSFDTLSELLEDCPASVYEPKLAYIQSIAEKFRYPLDTYTGELTKCIADELSGISV